MLYALFFKVELKQVRKSKSGVGASRLSSINLYLWFSSKIYLHMANFKLKLYNIDVMIALYVIISSDTLN
jgi:hypothetical protein